jgi:uncharacterized protein YndB with AHSA1/START domain
MPISFEVSTIIQASPPAIYHAWLDSQGHTAMTGSPAQVSPEVGAAFSAWDGYIHGKNLELDPPRRILQTWRTAEFADSDPDSLLEVLLEPEGGGTRVTLRHSNLPPHGDQYREGWEESYFTPMKAFFEG